VESVLLPPRQAPLTRLGAPVLASFVDRFGESDRVSEFDAMAAEAFGSEDLREGIRAFRERRSPKFRGK